MKRQSNTPTIQIAIAGLAALLLAGCATTTDEGPAPTTTTSQVKQSEFEQGGMPKQGTESTTRAALDLGTIYFDFDRSDIRSDARPVLRGNAETLRGSGTRVTVEGHTDERGSEEYNLALGERRASATKRYLENLGVPRTQLQTVSYGEARPAVLGHDESAWSRNRRAEFVVSR